jgi:hypothetical protein
MTGEAKLKKVFPADRRNPPEKLIRLPFEKERKGNSCLIESRSASLTATIFQPAGNPSTFPNSRTPRQSSSNQRTNVPDTSV